jgi:hypothetical protein
MKPLLSALLVIFVCATGFSALPDYSVASPQTLPATDRLPGVDLAEGISQLTGVAISPLLGVSAVGAWRYHKTPEAKRHLLPWFCSPYVWTIGFCLIGLCFLKDVLGTAAPPLVKKPFDIVELLESKVSALVACSAFLPFIVSQMAQHTSPATEAFLSQPPEFFFASILALNVGFDPRFLTIPLAIVAFLVVWLTGHAINVLIALCPFGIIDGVLKLFKVALLSSVVLSALINPLFGAAVSLVILFIAARLAPWAFRLTTFGTLFGLDVVWPWGGRSNVRSTEPHAFLARGIGPAPTRTYGRLARSESGAGTFIYRPWLVFPERSIAIPPGNIAIAKGLLFPSLLHRPTEDQRHVILVIFLPRYRGHEQLIANHFEIIDIHDSPLIKGFRAIKAWISDTINLGKSKYAEIRSTRMA